MTESSHASARDPEDAGVSLSALPALACPPGAGAIADEAGARAVPRREAVALFEAGPLLLAHASLTARRLKLEPPPRSHRHFDVLELWAFVRPARFCAPSPSGLALGLGLAEPRTPAEQAATLREGAQRLLAELQNPAMAHREEAYDLALSLSRMGWPWGPLVLEALESAGVRQRRARGSGLDVWNRLPEWEDEAPRGDPGSRPVDSESVRIRLDHLLQARGLDEARPSQSDYAAEAAHVFAPRDEEGGVRLLLAEAGTGTGKTLGYLAPASVYAERNRGGVWVSTYTRALQRQIARESASLWPEKGRVVVRKGRENYLCLLNLQERVQASQLGQGDGIGMALVAWWALHSVDGDMNGADFPSWLPGLFAVGAGAQASPANLVDRRGECIHSACLHYRRCFIERTVRASRRADIVIANHALVMSQAAFDRVREQGGQRADVETLATTRIVFDEGHHLFEAADSAFSARLSGQETWELRRWIRGPETRGRRGRGLEQRLGELFSDDETAARAMQQAIRAASQLPAEGFAGRIAPPVGEASPSGPLEQFFKAALDQLRARSPDPNDLEGGLECALHPAIASLTDAARAAALALAELEGPLKALARHLEDRLDEEADTLEPAARARMEGALRGLERRARLMLPAWRHMLSRLSQDDEAPSERFVDWLSADAGFGRILDVGLNRHWLDPTEPLSEAVIAPAHGVMVTSATLTDPMQAEPFDLARLRSGAVHIAAPVRTVQVPSPFDYGTQARLIVVNDLVRGDVRQSAAAMRALFMASGGGAIGLFTAIKRLRAAYERLAPDLAEAGLPLYAQHIDPIEVGSLIDIFRIEPDACLLGTDAVRDGVDVPGRSLRLLVFDRVPWPRPDLLHKARREHFGGRAYDDALARARIAQAFGRLIRRSEDRGVFVMLDAAAPTRLFAGLPEGVEIERMGLADAVEAVGAFLQRP